jgi:uncharacterized membrane protein
MALSDQLSRLATRTKELEDRAAAANAKGKADLERDVRAAGEAAQAQADALAQAVDAGENRVSISWGNLQRSWSDHMAVVRQHIDDRRSSHDLHVAQRNAEQAESDASFAIDYAYGAVEEAEYAVLDATLARIEADELDGAS